MVTRKLNVVIAGDAAPLGRAFKDASDDADGFGKGIMDKLGGAPMMAGLAGAGALLGVAVVDGFMTGMENEQAADRVQAQFAIPDDVMAAMGTAAGTLYGNAYGESMAEVQGVLGDLFNADVDTMDMERLGAKVLDIQTAFDMGSAEIVDSARLLVVNGMADNMDAALDIVTTGLQTLGTKGREEILPVFNEYSGLLGDLGIDGALAISMFEGAADAGVMNIDKAADALKEFGIRIQEEGGAVTDVLNDMNLDAEDLQSTIAAGGPAAVTAMSEIMTALESIEDPIERNRLGVELFGTQWEDVGEDVIFAMNPAKLAIDDVAGAAEAMGTVLNDNLATDVEGFKRKAMQGISDGVTDVALPAINSLVDAFNEDGLAGVIDVVGTAFEDGFNELVVWLESEGLSMLANFFFVTLPVAIGKAVVALVEVNNKIGLAAIGALWSGLKRGWSEVFAWLSRLPGFAATALADIGGALLGKGEELLAGLQAGARVGWGKLWGFLRSLPGGMVAAVGDLGGRLFAKGAALIQGFINGIWSKAKPLTDAFNGTVGRLPGVPDIGPSGMGPGFMGAVSSIMRAHGGRVPRASSGFTVPGMMGQAVPMVLHGGEQVLPVGAVAGQNFGAGPGGGRGGDTFITIEVNSPATRADAERIKQVLRDDARRGGNTIAGLG